MAAPPLMRSLSTRTVKKLEKPRPLKTSTSQTKIQCETLSSGLPVALKSVMSLVEKVTQNLVDKIYDEHLITNTAVMHSTLKLHGQQLEAIYKDQLDRAFVIFRDGCQDDDLECNTRLQLLELVELRAKQWSSCDNIFTYYSAKMATTELEPIVTNTEANTSSTTVSSPSPPNPPVLGPGEVLKTSGKFPKPMKIPGKNYCKDEVIIRNSDSGKVMGIKGRRVHMIEEISETIISFQRVEFMRPLIIKSPVNWNSARYLYPPHFFRPSYPSVWLPRPAYLVNPGAKERLVQITGPTEDKIVYARQLMEETIRRNASPVREGSERERMGGSSSSLNSSASDESNRLNHPGSRRPALMHSYSTNDTTLGEYKYTVSLGDDSVKITGTNYETVRNARLVLEEYYNIWLQKNIIGDCYGIDEDVFIDPLPDIGMMRLNSVDSGNGNGPSTSTGSGGSDDITCISSIPGPGPDLGLSYQSMYPLPQLEKSRPLLGRSNSSSLPSVSVDSHDLVAVSRKYSRDFLLECALSPHSKVYPPNWDQIVIECPAIVKKF